MKRSILVVLFALSLVGCEKKESEPDGSLKTVTYTFAPNGASSEIIYKSVQQGTQINAGYKVALFSINDQVTIGDKTTLIMQTTSNMPSGYEIRITYKNKTIASVSGNKQLALQKTFSTEDFK